MPEPTIAFPILLTGPARIVCSAVSVRRTATMRTQNTTTPATHANALSTWSASIQSSKLTPPRPPSRSGGRSGGGERDHARGGDRRGDQLAVRVDERRFEERQVSVPVLDPPDRPHRSGPGGSKEGDRELGRGLELVGPERREQCGPDRVVEHRCIERQFDRAGLGAEVDELEPERGGGGWEGNPAFDGIPERSGA